MRNDVRRTGLFAIAGGLFGYCAVQIGLHMGLPPVLDNDLVRGTLFGACLGLEIIGVMLIAQSRA